MSLNNLLNKHPGKAFVLLVLYFVCVVVGFTWVITPVKPIKSQPTAIAVTNENSVVNHVNSKKLFSTSYGQVKLSEKDIECLMLNAYHEARGEGVAGIQAATIVVLNRTAKKHMNANTVCQTVYKPKQFSWTHLDVRHKPINKSEMEIVKTAVLDLLLTPLSKLDKDVQKVKDSLYYHETNIKWKYANSFTVSSKIKNHIFYA
jgi:spore germination cell wall hydrolase CwlJ-like protein